MEVINIAETKSTNTYVAENSAALPNVCVVRAISQTAGRGQRGNSWESENGKNLTFSVLLRPRHIAPAEQFTISRAVTVAVASVLEKQLSTAVEIKWPNDIYVGNRKICGILIEISLMGSLIERCIAGIGVNVNQKDFLSDAPNPVSMFQIAGHEFPLDDLQQQFADEIEKCLVLTETPEGTKQIQQRYDSRLYRRNGFHTYRLPSGETFQAEIAGIAPNGILSLRLPGGVIEKFAFKEVAFVI